MPKKAPETIIVENEFMTTREAAEELGWGEDIPKVQRFIKSGHLKAQKAGWVYLIPRSEVKRLKEQLEEQDEN